MIARCEEITQRLERFPGPEFLMEINPQSLQDLMDAHELSIDLLSVIVRRSDFLLEKIVSGEKKITGEAVERVGRFFRVRPILAPGNTGPYLIQRCSRSVHMLRVARGLNSKQLAERIGNTVTAAHLRRYQRGNIGISAEVADKLAQVFRIEFISR